MATGSITVENDWKSKILGFNNTASIQLNFGTEIDASNLVNIVVFSAGASHQILSIINCSSSVSIQNIGSTAMTASLSGDTVTISRSDNSTIWGQITVIVSANFNMTV